MPFLPVAPPQPVAVYSGFDYMTADAQRHRVYAAHSGNRSLLVVNADDGRVVGQVRAGVLHGVAVNPENGHVYTGSGEPADVSEVDPVALKVVASVKVAGPVDAIAYDPSLHRIYAAEDDGTRMFIIDALTMKQTGTVALPPGGPESFAIEPATRRVYLNIKELGAFVIIDPQSLEVVQTVKTPELKSNHPLQIDPLLQHLYIAGENGVLSTYDLAGRLLSRIPFAAGVDQCDLDGERHLLVCAGNGGVTVFHDAGADGVSVVGTRRIAPGVHTVAVDAQNGTFWVVWARRQEMGGAFVQGFHETQ